MPNLKSAPELNVTMRETPSYATMGSPFQLNVFLLGHADGLALNSPVKVRSIRDAMELMEDNLDSPLLRGMLEAYYAGARNIWIMPVAPMSEAYSVYDDETIGGSTIQTLDQFDTTYKPRLDTAYGILENWDLAHIIVPIGARLNDYDIKVDYLTQLASLCHRAGVLSGNIHLGLLGVKGAVDEELVNAISEDARIINSVDDNYRNYDVSSRWGSMVKYVSVFAGETEFGYRELPVAYRTSPVAAIAGMVAQTNIGSSIVNKGLRYATRVLEWSIDDSDVDRLAQLGVNLIGEDSRGRRGEPFHIRVLTDNTLAEEESIFWSLTQLASTALVVSEIRAICMAYIGSARIHELELSIRTFLTNLVSESQIREYSVRVSRAPQDPNSVLIDLYIKPFFAVRDINVSISVGPEKV